MSLKKEGSNKPTCKHCGAPLLDSRAEETGFCCAGCAYVHRLVHENGLGGYYNLKDSHTAPADPSVFQPRDYTWLVEAQTEAEQSAAVSKSSIPEMTLSIQGISCAGCVWLIERLFNKETGARDIMVNAQTGEMLLRWEREHFSAVDFARTLQSFGYLAGPPGEKSDDGEARSLVKRMGLCAAFAMNVMLFTLPAYFGMEATFEYAHLFSTISLAFATLSFLVGGSYFIARALQMLRDGELHIDLPIAVGIVGAYLGSLYGWLSGDERFIYFDFVASFILLMLAGRWAQVVAVERNQAQLLRNQLKPPRLKVPQSGGACTEIRPEQLLKDQAFLLGPGQTNPVEARLLNSDASMSLASINGEGEPRIFRAGEIIPSGALNIGRTELHLIARELWKDSLLSRLIQPGLRLGARHRFLEKVIKGYLIGIFIAAFGGGVAWWLISGDAHQTWSVVTAVLVVSCPCAIGLAFPLADEMAASALRRRGVYVRENDLWARLGKVRTIVFDKTGTLTLETPEVSNPSSLASLSTHQRSALHCLIKDSAHPLSQSLLAELLASGPSSPAPGEPTEEIGSGLLLKIDQDLWKLGKPAWALGKEAYAHFIQTPSTTEGEATVALSLNGGLIEAFGFVDHARADAADELKQLLNQGFQVKILSGDHPDKVDKLAKALKLPEGTALGSLSPEAKAEWITKHDKNDTLMLGDGANDSLAFDRALCRGTPVIHRGMLEQRADFFYLGRGISGIRALFRTDQIRSHTQTAILAFSLFYNVSAVGLALAGHMNPLVAAILMPANSLLTLLIVSKGMRRAFTF